MKFDHRSLRGLTLWQPMGWAVWKKFKLIENRGFRPWPGVTHVAIHAGKRWHEDHRLQIREYLGINVPQRDSSEIHHGAVLAIARLGKIWTEDDEGVEHQRWFSGPLGWELQDVQPLDPIPCQGAQGLWLLPKPVFDKIVAQLESP